MKQIPGYSKYLIDTDGNVFSTLTNKVLKPGTYAKGYKYVQIRSDTGELKNKRVHVLVAIAYIPNPLGLPQVHHKDEDKSNNYYLNLEWCTGHFNQQQSAYKKHKPIEMLDLSGAVIKTYASLKEAAKCVGAPESTISRVCNGQRKTAAGYKWRYLNND